MATLEISAKIRRSNSGWISQYKLMFSRRPGRFWERITSRPTKLARATMFAIVALWFHQPPGGRGLATKMCEHSQESAKKLGYKAMQFNFVASSNEGAIKLWKKLGFESVGLLPKAFNHKRLGYVDALVMYKQLERT